MIHTGLTYPFVTTLIIDPATPATLYAGTLGGGMFKTTDSGDHWTAINTGLTALSVQSLIIDPHNPSILYAGTLNGMFKSTNGGDNWTALTISDISRRRIRSIPGD